MRYVIFSKSQIETRRRTKVCIEKENIFNNSPQPSTESSFIFKTLQQRRAVTRHSCKDSH